MDKDAIAVSTIPGSTYQRKDFLTACGAAWSQLNILLPQQFANSLVFLTKLANTLGLHLTLWQVLSTYDSFTVEVLISIATRRRGLRIAAAAIGEPARARILCCLVD
jgi:hypothetical protein